MLPWINRSVVGKERVNCSSTISVTSISISLFVSGVYDSSISRVAPSESLKRISTVEEILNFVRLYAKESVAGFDIIVAIMFNQNYILNQVFERTLFY